MTTRFFTHAFPSVTLALLVGACGAGGSEPSSSADAEPLASTGALTSSEILGSIACGETLTAAYTGWPTYGAYAFKGSAGEAVTVAVDGSTNAKAEAWLLRSDFSQVTSSAATTDTSFHVTLQKTETYYVAFRNKAGAAETFDVSIACPSALDGGVDSGSTNSGSTDSGSADGGGDDGAAGNVDAGTDDAGSADGGAGDTGAAGCATGETLCGASCVDTTSDSANCGACGSACESGQTCAGATCTPPDPFSASFCASTGAPMTTDSAASHVPAGGWQATIGRYAQITRVRSCASLTGCAPWTSAAPFDTSYLTTVYFPNLTAYFPDAGNINLYVNGSSVELMLQSDPGVYANAPSSAGYMDQSLTISGAPTYASSVNFGASSASTIEFIGSDVEASSFPSAITLTDHCVQSVIDASNAGNQDPWTEVQTAFYGTF